MEFEWDETKARANEQKHGIDFTEAMTVFADALSLTVMIPTIPRTKTDISQWDSPLRDDCLLCATPIAT
ncbi:MAG: BrnT family toxin, partial [Planctomycetia bacterium]|nr:BrnT family toxin [Planctomycetia bacterium]